MPQKLHEWAELKRQLEALQQITIAKHGKRFRMRNDSEPLAAAAILAAGIPAGPAITQIP